MKCAAFISHVQCAPRGHFYSLRPGGHSLIKTLAAAVEIGFRGEFFPAGSRFEQIRDDSYRHGVYMRPERKFIICGRIFEICPGIQSNDERGQELKP